ncbi:hypothetical protein [Streptomyces mayteni]
MAHPVGIVVAALLGAAGTTVTALAGAAPPFAAATGAGTAVLAYVAYARAAGPGAAAPAPHREARPAFAPATPADTGGWLRRATAAAELLAAHRRASDDESPLARTLDDAADVVGDAAEQLRQRAGTISRIDAVTTGPDARRLLADAGRLRREAAALAPGPLRRAKEASARAAAERAASRQRLEEVRELLMATLESTVLGLEAAAERAAVLASLEVATDASAGVEVDLAPLTEELAAVTEGLDELGEISRRLAIEQGGA